MSTKRRIILLPLMLALLTTASLGQARSRAGTPREKRAAREFKALLDLKARLERIPFDSGEREPHKSFLKANEKRIVFNDPAAQYLVRSDEFWRLRYKYRDLAIADDIAWAAAENPLPGECEGSMTCGVHYVQVTLGRYLRYYPKGRHRKTALALLKSGLTSYADERQAGVGFTAPEDATERAELQRMLRELDTVATKVPGREAAELRKLIERIADSYR